MEKSNIFSKFFNLIKVESDLERANEVHEDIVKDIEFRGTNLWILILAIIIASIGLNMNSSSVIIGAMLISPIDGPIKGLGYSIATYNITLFRNALKNLLLAIITGLITATFYFLVSPISTAHSEILIRTSPTIFDVLIALSAGLAGIIALRSKHKGNVIPGVAIATALLPPICTAGFGIASGQFNYFLGALYLFMINAVFMAFAAVIVSQALKFPIRKDIDELKKKKLNQWISIIIIVVLIPSVYFGYRLVKKEQFIENSRNYIQNVSLVNGNYLLDNEINYESKIIRLIYGGTVLNDEQKVRIINRRKDFNLDKVKIEFVQGLAIKGAGTGTEIDKLKAELNSLNYLYKDKIRELERKELTKEKGLLILEELRAFYPGLKSVSYAETYLYEDSIKVELPLIYISTQYELNQADRNKINHWLKRRLHKKTIKVIFEHKEDLVYKILSDSIRLNN